MSSTKQHSVKGRKNVDLKEPKYYNKISAEELFVVFPFDDSVVLCLEPFTFFHLTLVGYQQLTG